MKKGTKAAMIIAGCCLGAGITLSVIGFALNGGRFTKQVIHIGEEAGASIDDHTMIERVYEAESDAIDGIYVNNRNNGIEIYPSPDGKLRVTYYESNNIKYSVKESEGRLKINVETYKKWYDYISFGWWEDDSENIDMRIEVPEQMIAEMNVETSNDQIRVDNVTLKDECVFRSSNGRIEVNGVEGDASLTLKSSNAKIILNDVRAEEIEADTSNGGIEFCNVEAEELSADTSNAGIELEGTILADDIDLETSNGKVSGIITGRESDYEITSKTSNGSNSLPEDRSGGTKKLRVKTSNAKIDVSFSER